jgi:hypothetical protein
MDLRSAAVVVVGSFVFAGCATAIDDSGGRSSSNVHDSAVVRWDSSPPSSSDTGKPPSEDTGTTSDDTRPVEYDSGPGYDTAPPERDTAVGPGPTGDPCSDCANTKCSAEIAACMSDTECSAQMDCLVTCSDSTCADACAAAHPSTKVDTMFSCVGTKCSAECSGP